VTDASAQCSICFAPLIPRFTLPVLHGRHTARYLECTACGSLQVTDPFWLDEAYALDPTGRAGDPDTGRFRRNFSAVRYVLSLVDALVVPSPPTFLDFGSGTGLLTAMLTAAGFDAWTCDPHVDDALLAPGCSVPWEHLDRIPACDCITALEVFEHLPDPLAVGRRLRSHLRPGGCLVVSTSLYRPSAHGADWPYLSPEWGQHVTFWTDAAFVAYARELDYRSIGYFPGGEGFLVILSTKEPDDLAAGLEAASGALESPKLLHAMTDAWDFRGDVFPTIAPRVVGVDPAGG
jgi:SAM-dependent methyltransferase